MGIQNSFNSFVTEIKKTMETKQLTEELHDTFVMFVYNLYNFIVYYNASFSVDLFTVA